MFGSVVLEVFLLLITLSVIVMAAVELIASIFGMRSAVLVRGIQSLLFERRGASEPRLTDEVLVHPALAPLYGNPSRSGAARPRGRAPSYVPGRSFAIALLDTIRRRQTKTAATALPISAAELFGQAPDIVSRMPEGPLKDALSLVVGRTAEAERTIQRRADHVERSMSQWFDDVMDRASGWYKRRTQYLAFLLAAALVVCVNAGMLDVLDEFWAHATVLESIDDAAVVVAEPAVADPSVPVGTKRTLGGFLRFPIGWEEDETLEGAFADVATGLRSVIGWLLTALALTLGAGVWFDVLKRFSRVRGSGMPPQ